MNTRTKLCSEKDNVNKKETNNHKTTTCESHQTLRLGEGQGNEFETGSE